MTAHNVALHLLVVFVFAVFLIVLYWVCRKADSQIISRFSSRRSSQTSLASKKSNASINPRQCAINLVTNANPDVLDPKNAPPAYV
ncbi:unnamed protein product [Caenorhabditis sp. 36 PRJEB53466]|nr:unnamed protein product [Caenorhabditis sp. 36 PRJEB53466]